MSGGQPEIKDFWRRRSNPGRVRTCTPGMNARGPTATSRFPRHIPHIRVSIVCFDASDFKPCAAFSSVGHTDIPPVCLGYLFDDTLDQSRFLRHWESIRLQTRICAHRHRSGAIVFDVETISNGPNRDRHVRSTVFHRVRQKIR